MSKQITVRLPDDQVEYLDRQVASGEASSRAAAIGRALRRDQRRRRAESDLERILATGEDSESAGLREWASQRSYPDLD